MKLIYVRTGQVENSQITKKPIFTVRNSFTHICEDTDVDVLCANFLEKYHEVKVIDWPFADWQGDSKI